MSLCTAGGVTSTAGSGECLPSVHILSMVGGVKIALFMYRE